jgi:oligopeptide transport system permease protein
MRRWLMPKLNVNPATAGLMCMALAIVLYVVVAPLTHNAFALNPQAVLTAPSTIHWLGTDDLGRDLFARSALGGQLSLVIGLTAAGLATVWGTLVGLVAGSRGGWTDQLNVRLMDVLYSLPLLMVVILLGIWLGRGMTSLIVALALLSWPDTARLVRGHTQQLVKQEFIEAFRSLGGGTGRLFVWHLLPNLWPTVLVSLTMLIPRMILAESTLSFMGLGIEPPLSTWGTLSSEGWQLVRVAPHLLWVPLVQIVGTMWVLQIAAERLQQGWANVASMREGGH